MIRPFHGFAPTRRFVTRVGFALTLSLLGATLPTSRASAQTDAALAESLFREGKRLMSENKFAEACPKFAESYRLDPGLGTLLNLASCYESEGKIASAWAQYSEALARARREGDNDRAQFAEERVAALEPKLPKLSVSVAKEASVPGLVVKLDGQQLNNAVLGVPVPIDPGVHQLEASAPGKETWTQSIKFEAGSPVIAVTIAPLRDSSAAPPAAAPPPAPGAPPAQPMQPQPAPPSSERGSSRPIVLAGIATGVFAIGAITTGVLYSQKRSDFEKSNENLDPKRFDERDSANTLGIVNLVLIGATAAAGGITIYLIASRSSSDATPPAAAKLELIPAIGPGVGALSVRGSL